MERHCGQVKVMMYGHKVEKPVYCNGWHGSLFGKAKGTYSRSTLRTNGRFGDFHTWTDLVIFDGWVRVLAKQHTDLIYVRHLVETTKQRILGKVK